MLGSLPKVLLFLSLVMLKQQLLMVSLLVDWFSWYPHRPLVIHAILHILSYSFWNKWQYSCVSHEIWKWENIWLAIWLIWLAMHARHLMWWPMSYWNWVNLGGPPFYTINWIPSNSNSASLFPFSFTSQMPLPLDPLHESISSFPSFFCAPFYFPW